MIIVIEYALNRSNIIYRSIFTFKFILEGDYKMTDKKQEMVSHMSISELNQLISRLEAEIEILEKNKDGLELELSRISSAQAKLTNRLDELYHKKAKLNNTVLLKSYNEKREILIERLKKQGINLTEEFEDFINKNCDSLVFRNEVIAADHDLSKEDGLDEALAGTGAVLFFSVISLPNEKCGRLLAELAKNNVEREEEREYLGYPQVVSQIEDANTQYDETLVQQREVEGDLRYCDVIIAEKQALLAYCSERIGTSSISTNRQKSIGVMPASPKGNQ